MKSFTGTITHEPQKVGRNCYSLSMISEDGLQYTITVDEWTRSHMYLKTGRTVQAEGVIYANPTTGISEIDPYKLVVQPMSCPSTRAVPKHKRSPHRKGPSRKQCPMPTQAAFAI